MTGRRGRERKQLLGGLKEKRRIQKIERGSSRSKSVENSLRKRPGTCRKTYCTMNESAQLLSFPVTWFYRKRLWLLFAAIIQ